MSTDSFNLAPAEAGATPTPTTKTTPTPTGTTSKSKAKKQPAAPDTPTDGTVAGAVIPAAALTAFISLCWLTHQFGLPLVLAGVIACALAASAALAAKARKGARPVRDARKNALGAAGRGRTGAGGGSSGGGAAGGGLGRSPRTGGGSTGRGATGLGAASPSAKKNGSQGGPGRIPSAAGSGTRAQGGGTLSATKPSGLIAPKSSRSSGKGPSGAGFGGGTRTPGAGAANSIPKQNRGTNTTPGAGGTGTAAGGPGKLGPLRGLGGGLRGGANKPGGTGAHGRLERAHDRKTNGGGNGTLGSLKPHKPAPRISTPTRPLSKAEKKQERAAKTAAAQNRKAAGTLGKILPENLAPQPAGKGLRARRHRRINGKLNKAQGKLATIKGIQHDKAELKKTRAKLKKLRKIRIRKIFHPARAVTRRLSKVGAVAWRFGTQAFNRAHMLLGNIRYSDIGPNWVRPMARLFHALTSPVARLIHKTGSWGWLNRWMYGNTVIQPNPTLKPVSPGAVAAAVIRNSAHNARHTTFVSPGTTAPKGSTTVSSDISGAMPLVYAAEAVRAAGIMLLVNPADNMHGYAATIKQLADVQAAISQVIQAAAETTRENFAVNPIISDAYDDTAGYGYSLAERLEAIPTLFQMIHADQIHNLENPTPQAAKWDIGNNLNG
ncbi:hypothetical protein ACWCPT_30020 [Streptomyces sp. NPDC002308]